MATYAIGDIQGCYTALHALLAHLPWDPQHDRLWFVGDLVNRGPESADVLRFIRSLGNRATTVLGNHDLYLLAVAEGLVPLRPKDTFGDVLDAPDREELLAWLRQRPLLHREGPHLMIHAGLLPQWSLADAAGFAGEVERALQGPDARRVLGSFFTLERGDWSADLTGPTRMKAITDVLTRLRICTPSGHINHQFKGEAKDIPDGYLPWFEVPNRRHAEATVVFGHWSALGLYLAPNVLGLDSGCVWGRSLTAVRLEDRQLFQVPCQQCRAPRRS